VVGAVIGFIVIIAIVLYCCSKNKNKNTPSGQPQVMGAGPTNQFSKAAIYPKQSPQQDSVIVPVPVNYGNDLFYEQQSPSHNPGYQPPYNQPPGITPINMNASFSPGPQYNPNPQDPQMVPLPLLPATSGPTNNFQPQPNNNGPFQPPITEQPQNQQNRAAFNPESMDM